MNAWAGEADEKKAATKKSTDDTKSGAPYKIGAMLFRTSIKKLAIIDGVTIFP